MLTVELQNLVFQAHHGVYHEEKKVMNQFEVNLLVRYEEGATDFSSVKDVVSYVHLYDIVKEKIQVPVFLLEKICQSIILEISGQYPYVKEISISIYKLRAPIQNFVGKAGVTMQKFF